MSKKLNTYEFLEFFSSNLEPIVFDGPTVYEAVMDETVSLECGVNEKLALRRHWEFNGNVLPSGL